MSAERDETIEDLEVSGEQAEEVTGGFADSEGPQPHLGPEPHLRDQGGVRRG